MAGKRFAAALAAAALPFFMTTWIELVAVDQPAKIDPGTTFTATVQGIGHEWQGPLPLDPKTSSGSDAVSPTDTLPSGMTDNPVRLGVLVPEAWDVGAVSWMAESEGGGPLAEDPDEASLYEGYYPAPPGYRWLAFRGDVVAVVEGQSFSYKARISTTDTIGMFEVVYMTWSQPPIMYEPATGSGAPDIYPWPYPGPSFIETTITVGDVGPAPQIERWQPTDGAADVPLGSDIRVTFDRDMDVRSLREGGILLYSGPVWYATGSVDGGPSWHESNPLAPDFMPPPWEPYPVPTQIFYNAAERTAVIDPLQLLEPHQVYTVIVTNQAKATDGVPVDTVQTASFLTVRGPEPPFFSDVPPDHRFRPAIETLFYARIIEGFADGTFRPETPVTRAHAAQWLVQLLGIHTPEPGPPPPFGDVPVTPGDPTADFIGEAAEAGIIVGFEDGMFRPNDSLTRIQLTRMIVRAAQSWMTPPDPGFTAGFLDVDPADRGYVDWAYYNDLVDGKEPGRFDPWSTATRGHAARILYGVFNLMQPRPLPVPEPYTGPGSISP